MLCPMTPVPTQPTRGSFSTTSHHSMKPSPDPGRSWIGLRPLLVIRPAAATAFDSHSKKGRRLCDLCGFGDQNRVRKIERERPNEYAEQLELRSIERVGQNNNYSEHHNRRHDGPAGSLGKFRHDRPSGRVHDHRNWRRSGFQGEWFKLRSLAWALRNDLGGRACAAEYAGAVQCPDRVGNDGLAVRRDSGECILVATFRDGTVVVGSIAGRYLAGELGEGPI